MGVGYWGSDGDADGARTGTEPFSTVSHVRAQSSVRRMPIELCPQTVEDCRRRLRPPTCARPPLPPPAPAMVSPRLLDWYRTPRATCRGARRATRIASSCPESCSSRRRSIGFCRSTTSGSTATRPSMRSPARPRRTSSARGIRSATTSGRGGCRPSPARP